LLKKPGQDQGGRRGGEAVKIELRRRLAEKNLLIWGFASRWRNWEHRLKIS
jgi:hypothetical protein